MKAKIDAIPVLESQKQNSGKLFAFLPWILLHLILLNSLIFLCDLSILFTSNCIKRSLSSVKKYLPSIASLNWINPTSMLVVFEVNEVEVLQVKRLCSVCLNAMEVFIKNCSWLFQSHATRNYSLASRTWFSHQHRWMERLWWSCRYWVWKALKSKSRWQWICWWWTSY